MIRRTPHGARLIVPTNGGTSTTSVTRRTPLQSRLGRQIQRQPTPRVRREHIAACARPDTGCTGPRARGGNDAYFSSSATIAGGRSSAADMVVTATRGRRGPQRLGGTGPSHRHRPTPTSCRRGDSTARAQLRDRRTHRTEVGRPAWRPAAGVGNQVNGEKADGTQRALREVDASSGKLARKRRNRPHGTGNGFYYATVTSAPLAGGRVADGPTGRNPSAAARTTSLTGTDDAWGTASGPTSRPRAWKPCSRAARVGLPRSGWAATASTETGSASRSGFGLNQANAFWTEATNFGRNSASTQQAVDDVVAHSRPRHLPDTPGGWAALQ